MEPCIVAVPMMRIIRNMKGRGTVPFTIWPMDLMPLAAHMKQMIHTARVAKKLGTLKVVGSVSS